MVIKRKVWKRRKDGIKQRYTVGKKKYKRGPRPSNLIKVKAFNTKYIQDKKTGRMIGRKSLRGVGDKTGVLMDRTTGRIFGKTKRYTKNYGSVPMKDKLIFVDDKGHRIDFPEKGFDPLIMEYPDQLKKVAEMAPAKFEHAKPKRVK